MCLKTLFVGMEIRRHVRFVLSIRNFAFSPVYFSEGFPESSTNEDWDQVWKETFLSGDSSDAYSWTPGHNSNVMQHSQLANANETCCHMPDWIVPITRPILNQHG